VTRGFEPADGDHALTGVYFAIVTQNDDEAEVARVKVRLPWMPGGDSDQTFWAPVSVPMIGGEFGAYAVPEIEDTVLVAFIAGDIRYPVVIGGIWSETDTPPETNEDGKNDFRLIKSRSGHRLLLDDSSSGKLVLSDKSDKNVLACGPHGAGGSGANSYGVGAPPALTGDAGKGVSLGALDGTLNLLCPSGTLKVEAKTIEIQAVQGVDIKATGNVEIKGTGKALVQSSGPGQYEGSTTQVG
jgi:phage baseplate assembly protein gpV